MTDVEWQEGIRLLLVEDDAESGTALQLMLERRKAKVTFAASAEQALELFQPRLFDVVVADIRLEGGMSGVELLRRVRDQAPEFPVILLTAYDSLQTAIDAVRLGAQDYILKPLDGIEELLRPVNKAVRSYRMLLLNQALEAELAESEVRFRTVLENSLDVVFSFSIGKRRLDYVSPACEVVLGLSVDETAQLPLEQMAAVVHPDDRDVVWARFMREATRPGRRSSAARPVECRIVRHDGATRWLSITYRVLVGANQAPASIVGSARDITETRRLEVREQQLRDKLARAERLESLGVLAGTVAHDVSNILGPAALLPDMMLRELTRGPQAADFVKLERQAVSMKAAALQAIAVIRNLLSLGRRERFQAESLCLNRVVEEYLQTAGFDDLVARNGRVEVEKSLMDGLLPILGSTSHLLEVVMNLVTNAFDAMTEGGRLRIATANVYLDDPLNGYEVVPEGEYAILRVGDSGVGIPPSNLDRIFEPFFSSKPMGTHGGSGLGLAVVYGVIKDHKGYIDVRSEPGGGTEFTLYLPIGRNAVPTMMRQIPLPEVDGARILVVDDDLGMRHLLQTVFVEMGCEVTLATNGREAVQAITDEVVRGATRPDAGPFSLVFLDMNLDQDLNGLDTYREIVALAPRQRFVFMSGLGGSPEMEEVARSGLGQILTKPFSLEALTAVVSK